MDPCRDGLPAPARRRMGSRSPHRATRVLAVDHTAGVAPFRKKFEALAANPGIDLTVLAPDRWVENYRVVRATAGGQPGYRLLTGAVGWPGYENRGFFRSGLGPAIRSVRPDVLHLWEEPFSVITFQALSLAAIWAPKAKAIFFSFDNLSAGFRYSYRPSWLYARIERFAHRRCAAGTAVSEEVVQVLRAKGFRKPLEVIPHGIDLAEYSDVAQGTSDAPARRAPAEDVRGRLGLEPPVVGFVGRLLPQKGVDLLLRAVALLPSPRPSILILGDGPARGALEGVAADLGFGSSIRFLSGVQHDAVRGFMAAIDVLVLPSRTTPKWKEQFGRVLVEGMAAGCVVVGSSSGAIPEVVGDAGLIFPEDDVEGLAQALRRALGEPGLGEALRVRGRKRVRAYYTWEAIASRITDFYARLLAA